ncbi:ribbon-helix-helix domain-containing protein [Lichenifustis flavocetrariae]|uniref:Type II toxin-antitoxin system ParD family antitoxin n=1 Tax=Lichenifustis flavocetrariae TaxID=2949735 RepID=A0AA41ZB86_9HYPH|nr:type II toxin-antitoxin system ParD family antitoxin [Lichenifustis flavocetrariae]MCW6512702.1 type II toxin-antitoxin system ParD family antitoxin [Lichenifustis flavocetrariae]
MPAKHTLHVVLTETLVKYVRDKVVAGHHLTASDVIRHSLHKLMQRDDLQKLMVDAGRRADPNE